MSSEARDNIKNAIKKWMSIRIPGLYESLEPICMKVYKKDCLDLLLDEPDKFRELLISVFKDRHFVYLLVRYTIVKPLLDIFKKSELEEVVTSRFFNEPLKFKELLLDLVAA